MLRFVPTGLLVLLLAIQFIRPEKNLGNAAGPGELKAHQPVPPAVQDLLERACYDCHSNHTRYPWYANVQPVAWWLAAHIEDGKRHLNFSEFASYPAKKAAKKAAEIGDEVGEHQMPLKSYTLMHPEARLTPAEIKLLTDWAEALHDRLAPN